MNKQVLDVLSQIENGRKRQDTEILTEIMEQESGYKPSIHGSVIGFGHWSLPLLI